MSSDSLSNSIFLARQPIFDNNLDVFAYELLFRTNQSNQSGVNADNGDIATSQVINHTFLEFGIERVLDGKLGFINLTRTFLTGAISLPFNHDHIVLEVLEDIVADEEIIQSVKKFSKQGFTIALDDFIFREDLKPLVAVADIIKIDLLALSEQELIEHVQILRQFNVKLLAEKVESEAQFQLCKDLGFDYYQGFFFCKPTIINDKPLPENKISSLRILTELQRPDIDFDEVEELIKHDITLSYKLLRCINSAAFSLPRRIDSLRQAVLFLGLNAIKSWATIIAFSSIDSPATKELLTIGLIRAKMAEIIAPAFACNPDTSFMLGFFSIADAMFNKPMTELLKTIPVTEPIKRALETNEGELGQLLLFTQQHERGSVTTMPKTLSISQLNDAFLTATDWASYSLNTIK